MFPFPIFKEQTKPFYNGLLSLLIIIVLFLTNAYIFFNIQASSYFCLQNYIMYQSNIFPTFCIALFVVN